MSMSSSSSPVSDSSQMMMVPYLHFTGGDNLFFKSWKPSSSGAIAGACIGLLVLALLERGLAAVRGKLEIRWKKRFIFIRFSGIYLIVSIRALALTSEKQSDQSSTQSSVEAKGGSSSVRIVKRARMFAPFIPTNDIPRGLIYALQVLLGYILMLGIM